MAIDRRTFLKSLFTAAIASQVNIDTILRETAHLPDADFITYVTFSVRMWIDNPRYCGIITDIAEPE